MKQLLQNLRNGGLAVLEVPPPALRDAGILVRTHCSLISAGTERMALKLARKSLAGKAKDRPDLVRRVLQKLNRDGFWATFTAVRDQLDRETPMGYSLAGEVTAVGSHARRFHVGQRVACAGAGYASHAEINYVPHLLASEAPDGVESEAAAYATVGAIALQGIRNADAKVGESVAVIGLGLVGQLAVQLLYAAGCRVVGIDPEPSRRQLAAEHGAELVLDSKDGKCAEKAVPACRDRGADAVLITAATAGNAPVELAASLARDRARVVMVGVTGMTLPRKAYYEKELSFIVSRSYGPGRYDTHYEEHGRDYPIGHVRWTENRNLEAFLDLVGSGKVRPTVCTTHRFAIDEAAAAFDLILANRQPHLGVLLTYPHDETNARVGGPSTVRLLTPTSYRPTDKVGVSFIGAGNFARTVLLPALNKLAIVAPQGVVTQTGHSARSTASKFGFQFCSTKPGDVLQDKQTDLVFIATRHAQHAELVREALAAGKAVFVEKPLAVNINQLKSVYENISESPGRLMVGYNRRFSPLAIELKAHVRGRGPLTVQYRCNAGPQPPGHWLADPAEGGRLIGEACHFVDFFAYLTDSKPQTVYAAAPGGEPGDNAAITIHYADGSVCHLLYMTAGSASLGKERIEVFTKGRTAVLEDFRRLELATDGGRLRRRKLWRQDKGHEAELKELIDSVRTGRPMPIAADSLIDTTLTCFAAERSLAHGKPVKIDQLRTELTNPD